MNNKIKITIEDGRSVEVDYKTRVVEAVSLLVDNLDDVLAFKINNEVKSFDYELVKDSKIEFVKFASEDGYRIYSRTLKMILYMALTKLYSKADVEFISTIDKDQYFTVKNIDLTEEKVEDIKNKMNEIISRKLPIHRKSIPIEEATVLYTNSNDQMKLQTIDTKLKSFITMYFCDGMYNSFYGALAPNTSYVTAFNLVKYKDGIVLVIPGYDMNLNIAIKENTMYETFIEFNKLNAAIGISNVNDLNNTILQNKMDKTIQVAEAIQQRELVKLALDIENKKDTKMILIAGPSSSGKTTFAQKLGVQIRLNGYNPITISMDNYFKERNETPLGEDGKYNFECVEALDVELFNKQMKELIEGKTVELPEFDFYVGSKKYNEKYLKLEEKDILVIEGIHALNPILTEFTPNENKYKVYIAPIATLNIDGYTKVSSTDTRILRRMVRDFATRGHSVEKTFELWRNVKKGEEKYIFPFVETVDYIYNSSLVYEPSVMKIFAQPLLLQVEKTSTYYSEARRLYSYLNNFLPMESTNIPIDSIIREFIGNGCFHR